MQARRSHDVDEVKDRGWAHEDVDDEFEQALLGLLYLLRQA